MNLTLTRRTLSLAITAAFAAPSIALAQAPAVALVEGKNYLPVKPRQNVGADASKIEITEFFWYGCPHCNSIEQPLHDWLKKQGSDVVLRRSHIDFGERTDAHQRLFYALDALGELNKHHTAAFTAIHADRKPLANKTQVLDWVKSRGIDVTAFDAAYSSFTMATKLHQSKQLMADYKVDGVPYFAIDGHYATSPSIVGGSPSAFFAVLEALIAKIRAERKPAAKPAAKAPAKPATKPAN